MDLTARELQTIVAALRAWQNERSFHSLEELRRHYTLDDEPLSIDEIEQLVRRLVGGRR